MSMTFGGPEWWNEMGTNACDAGHAPFSADWYRSMRDQYVVRFPDADARSLQNMNDMVTHAEAREGESRE